MLSASTANDESKASSSKSARAGVACHRCRSMKMKCEGSENPPCTRCRKAKAGCIVPPRRLLQDDHAEFSDRLQPGNGFLSPDAQVLSDVHLPPLEHSTLSNKSMATPDAAGTDWTYTYMSPDTEVPNPNPSHRTHRTVPIVTQPLSELPSIYTIPPSELFRGEGNHKHDTKLPHSNTKRKRPGISIPDQHENVDWILENRMEAREIIQFFCEKCMVFLPVLLAKDFEDADKLIDNELSLVYCICYVAARFLPDSAHIQEKLYPKVEAVSRGDFPDGHNRGKVLSHMKALLILCCYANISSPSLQASELRKHEISFWSLKSYIELYAMQHSFYNSIQDLRAEILLPKTDLPIHETLAYHKYALWLQLFVVSHHASTMSGTPPGVQIDSTIRAVSWVIQKLGMHPQFRLLAEVELCLGWETASLKQPELKEWWCVQPLDFSDAMVETRTELASQEVERELEAWRAERREYMEGGLDGAILDYYSRCMKFCFSSYAIRRLRKSSGGISELQKHQVRRCVINANDVLIWNFQRSPVQKERIKYVPESSCTMTSFCCLFIIASCQTFGSTISGIEETLNNVILTAKLWMELAPTRENNAYYQGSVLLKRAETLMSTPEWLERHATASAGPMSSSPGVGTSDQAHLQTPDAAVDFPVYPNEMAMSLEEMYHQDGFWDFSMSLPNSW
ncbi:hypothetical protein VTL71DRAFT_13070 [Oculimacula yallundae]|uniref:Zn(2)-C6 fungal-type domain-containing protein n=1 Tax=Oculimacula yallundae TaxID=86028 RepID=A0ABR4CPH6_9HELO